MTHRTTTIIALILLLVLAACNSEILPDPNQDRPEAVEFDVYLGNRGGTRSGTPGEITTENIKNAAYQFGVYGYYTGETAWDSWKSSSMVPNYMYNQHVEWSTTSSEWTYAPLKYWPNGEGAANDDTGQGATQHKVSFFAYAPYVSLNIPASVGSGSPASADPTEDATTGITAINGCDTDGPLISYKLNTTPTQQVDLLYATPLTDQTKQAVNQRLQFDFHHALSCFEVYVLRVYNEVTASDPARTPDNDATKIFVGEFSMAGSVATEGTFSPQSGTWTSTTVPGSHTLTVGSDYITPALRGTTATDITSLRAYELDNWGSRTGVTETQTLLTTTAMMFIPPTSGSMSVTPTLKYSFVTHDDELRLSLTNTDGDKYFGRIPNTVSAASPVSFTVQPGKKYKLLCRIGVESMEFGVSSVDFEFIGVEDWDFPMRFDPTVSPYTSDNVIEKTLGGEDSYGSY